VLQFGGELQGSSLWLFLAIRFVEGERHESLAASLVQCSDFAGDDLAGAPSIVR
jgi:hypothetical protein